LASSLPVRLALAVSVFNAEGQLANQPAPKATQKWEHAAMTHNDSKVGGADLSRKINQMGDSGWELVDVSTVVVEGTTAKTIFYFKRPK
jgi:hypothetical protein